MNCKSAIAVALHFRYAMLCLPLARWNFLLQELTRLISAWIPNTDLTRLDPADIKDFAEKGKTKSLIGAYRVATEAHPLSHFKNMLDEHLKAMQADQEAREQREAEKASKAEKKRRKSVAAEEDVEMDDAEADEEGETKKSSKKRKKDVESEGDVEKVSMYSIISTLLAARNLTSTSPLQPTKTPKTAQKLKLTTPKAPGTAEKKTKETTKAAKLKSEKKKPAKAAASDEEMAEEEAKEPAKPLDPAEEKKAREKEGMILHICPSAHAAY